MVLFNGDRAAVFLRGADGRATAEVSRGLSQRYLQSVVDFPTRSLPSLAAAARRPMFSTDYRDDPRAGDVRAAVVQEGFDTLCTAPLLDGDELLGPAQRLPRHAARVDDRRARHDGRPRRAGRRRDQERPELREDGDLGRPAPVDPAARARGSSRLGDEREIGLAIATELRQLIDYHNVRVYRLRGDDLIPVAMQGQVGEYVDETPEQLAVKFGQGITGWVAEHRLAQNLPDAGADPRANTIPGTDDDLDESMLLAPMLVRGPGPRRPRPLEARAPPVQRRRPAAARDLRQLRRPGVRQRRRDRASSAPSPTPSAGSSPTSGRCSRSPSRS